MKPVCAVTGASGYVGSRLMDALTPDFTVVPVGRHPDETGIAWQLGESASLAPALRERFVRVLVHAAWDMRETSATANRATNVAGSLRLLDDAEDAGVGQIVFVSSISAFDGARSEYGKSKLLVEKRVLELGGTVVRPGLVWGERPGGMFGSLRAQTARGGLVPLVGDGSYPQFLVHEDDLAEVVRRAAHGEFRARVLTVAHPQPWPLHDLITRMAADQGRKVRLLPVPASLVYGSLKMAETLGMRLSFRSDSVTGLVHGNRAPVFTEGLGLRTYQ